MSEEVKREQIIIQQYDGIFSPHEIFYLFSLKYSADRSVVLFNEYEINKKRKVHPDQLFNLIHEALNHSAALSRYFWPVLPKRKKLNPDEELRLSRGQKLKKYFKMKEESVLHDTQLRNVFEHYDEYLDKYLMENMELGGTYYPGSLLGSINEVDEQYIKLFRFLDTEKDIIVLLGKKFELKPIKQEIVRILKFENYFDMNGGMLLEIENGKI